MRWMADVYDARREHCGDESVQRLAGTGVSRTQHRYPAFDRGGWGILTCGSAQVSQPPGPAPWASPRPRLGGKEPTRLSHRPFVFLCCIADSCVEKSVSFLPSLVFC